MNATLGYQFVAALASAANDHINYANGTAEERDVYNVTSPVPIGNEPDVSDEGGGDVAWDAVLPPQSPPQPPVYFTPEIARRGAYYVMSSMKGKALLQLPIFFATKQSIFIHRVVSYCRRRYTSRFNEPGSIFS
jgi:hypothetical protein